VSTGSTATLQSWNPNADQYVQGIDLSGSTVYVVGVFTSVGGATRNYAAAISIGSDNASGGSCLTAYDSSCLRSWNPSLGNTSTAVKVSGSIVYLGGQFTTVGSTTRNRMAAVSIGSDNGSGGSCLTAYAAACLTSWNPNVPAGNVAAIAVSGTTVYFGGAFTNVGNCGASCNRSRAAAVSISGTGNGSGGSCLTAYAAACLTSWNPVANSSVFGLLVSGSTVYLGGTFTTVLGSGNTRNGLAAVSTASTPVISSWNPNLGGGLASNAFGAYKMSLSGSTMYVVGNFTTVGGSSKRYNVAAIGTGGTLAAAWPTIPTPTVSSDSSGSPVGLGTTVKGDAEADVRSTPNSYQWQRCTSETTSSCQDIAGSEGGTTGAWWGSRNADMGKRVRLKAMWDTLDSTVTAFSAITGVFAPSSTTAPTLDQGLVGGAPKLGTLLHTSFGTWKGYIAGQSTVLFQWKRCSSSDPASCTTNVGTNAQWYTPVAGDVGKYLRVTATLTTGGQSVSASTAVSAQVASNVQVRRSGARAAVAKSKAHRKARR